ncbi:MAG TPA: hypothetical protein VIX81_08355 [Gammaproteobacteria bacterium]
MSESKSKRRANNSHPAGTLLGEEMGGWRYVIQDGDGNEVVSGWTRGDRATAQASVDAMCARRWQQQPRSESWSEVVGGKSLPDADEDEDAVAVDDDDEVEVEEEEEPR